MRKIKTWRDPYEAGFSTCRPKEVEIQDGLTVLVGCNGAGKTTLLFNIKEELEDANIPVHLYDNIQENTSSDLGYFMFNGDYALAAALCSSSEGESISIRLGNIAKGILSFLETGRFRKGDRTEALLDSFAEIMEQDDKVAERYEKLSKSKERWLLFDATDSGYSIDNVLDMKEVFQYILDKGKELGVDVYIVISANEYELADGEKCLDVNNGQYMTFKDYADYKKYILKSRALKDKRVQRVAEKAAAKKAKKKADI